ncbi:MAG: hypothetical protein M1833_002273 [Piccolia ochrophora]|nr:MAG: hypothetical protein M1833_002273 [Piccolia ochrophora]
MSLSYGLNITKKNPASKPAPAKRKPIFGEDDSDSEDAATTGATNGVEEIDLLGDDTSQPSKKTSATKPGLNGTSTKPKRGPSAYGDLSSKHTSLKHADEAVSLDPSIYDYDAAYDALHAASSTQKAADSADAAARKPKYMANLLAAAEVRQRDQLRAKEKMLAKEREAEGDEFADKEKFVTGAYKEQQAEVRRLEEEERLREEEERKRRKGTGMSGFYRSVLDRDEKRHEEAVAAAAEVQTDPDKAATAADDAVPKQKSEADVARALRAAGRDVSINDEGQVVDKRELLSAGLNIAPTPSTKNPSAPTSSAAHRPAASSAGSAAPQSKAAAQRAQRERQTRMLEEQLAQSEKRAREDEEGVEAERARAAKSRKTEGEIEGARERFLRRKREREEAAKEKKKDGEGKGKGT